MPQDLAPYLQNGVLGLIIVGIFSGWIWAKPAVDRLLQERDAQIAALTAERDRLIEEKRAVEEQRDAAISIAQERIVPLLTTFLATTQTLTPLLQEIVREAGDDHRRR